MKTRRQSLDDKTYAAFAWRRYRRLMLWMTLAAVAAVAVALGWLRTQGPVPLAMLLATVAGVGLSVMLAAALMGLIFLSSGTGHDEEADRWVKKED